MTRAEKDWVENSKFTILQCVEFLFSIQDANHCILDYYNHTPLDTIRTLLAEEGVIACTFFSGRALGPGYEAPAVGVYSNLPYPDLRDPGTSLDRHLCTLGNPAHICLGAPRLHTA